MEITGVQSVGARSLGGVQVTVSDPAQAASRVTAAAFERDGAPELPRASIPEAVVFPRDGTPIDHRPVQLRQARAQARYRRDGGKPQKREPSA